MKRHILRGLVALGLVVLATAIFGVVQQSKTSVVSALPKPGFEFVAKPGFVVCPTQSMIRDIIGYSGQNDIPKFTSMLLGHGGTCLSSEWGVKWVVVEFDTTKTLVGIRLANTPNGGVAWAPIQIIDNPVQDQNKSNENPAISNEARTTLLHLPWLELRKGMQAYTGTDGGGSTTVTVCSSPTAYEDFVNDVKGYEHQCAKKQQGISVSITSNKIVAENNGVSYLVYLRSDDSSWSGWTSSLVSLQPSIPNKTLLTIKANPNDPARLAPSRNSNLDTGVVLAPGTVVEMISQYPKSDSRDLFVSVQKGSAGLSGKKGWIFAMDVAGMTFVPAPLATTNQPRRAQ